MTLWRLLAAVAGVLALLSVLLAVIVYLPQQAIDPRGLSPGEKVKAIQDLRGTILQGLGGAALLGTLYFSARTLQLNRRGQVTERFTKAIEQLGDERLAVRLGSIYALEQIAMDSKELHWPVMEILTAFLRDSTLRDQGKGTQEPSEEHGEMPGHRLEADLQAVALVIGRRPAKRQRQEVGPRQLLDLRRVNLPLVDLQDAHLEGADLAGAHLGKANLVGAHLAEANLAGANLQGAMLFGAHLEEANLAGARLQGARFISFGLPWPDLVSGNFQGIERSEATGLTREQLKHAMLDETTELPSYLASVPAADDLDRR